MKRRSVNNKLKINSEAASYYAAHTHNHAWLIIKRSNQLPIRTSVSNCIALSRFYTLCECKIFRINIYVFKNVITSLTCKLFNVKPPKLHRRVQPMPNRIHFKKIENSPSCCRRFQTIINALSANITHIYIHILCS